MKKVIGVCAILCSLNMLGCSTWQRITNGGKTFEEERADREAARQHEIAKRNNLHPGMSIEEVKALWGQEDQNEFRSGHLVLRYENNHEPIDFVFNEKLELVEWAYDRAAADNYRMLAQQRAQQQANRKAFLDAAMYPRDPAPAPVYHLSPPLRPRSLNCTSNRIGNQTFTNCN
jgi:hypothetical protein